MCKHACSYIFIQANWHREEDPVGSKRRVWIFVNIYFGNLETINLLLITVYPYISSLVKMGTNLRAYTRIYANIREEFAFTSVEARNSTPMRECSRLIRRYAKLRTQHAYTRELFTSWRGAALRFSAGYSRTWGTQFYSICSYLSFH